MSGSSAKIDRREDVNPEYGENKYGDVKFADPVNNKYPIDTEEHVRAAWSYINHKDNAAKYDAASGSFSAYTAVPSSHAGPSNFHRAEPT